MGRFGLRMAVWISFGLLVLAPLGASASVMLRLSVEDLAARSDTVVRGMVVQSQSRWSKDGKRIVTEVQIAVDESLKGQPGKTVTVLQPGGSVGSIGQQVSGMASFSPQEKVVVFLEQQGSGPHFSLVGMGQGKWNVVEGGLFRSDQAVPTPVDATLLDPKTGDEVKQQLEPVSLPALRDAVKQSQKRAP